MRKKSIKNAWYFYQIVGNFIGVKMSNTSAAQQIWWRCTALNVCYCCYCYFTAKIFDPPGLHTHSLFWNAPVLLSVRFHVLVWVLCCSVQFSVHAIDDVSWMNIHHLPLRLSFFFAFSYFLHTHSANTLKFFFRFILALFNRFGMCIVHQNRFTVTTVCFFCTIASFYFCWYQHFFSRLRYFCCFLLIYYIYRSLCYNCTVCVRMCRRIYVATL